jgi:phosphatidyl-myo-inositol dimannoside synthase
VSALRALVVSPDFPPAPGGIQVLAHRLVTHLPGVRSRVLALGGDACDEWDRAHGVDIRRVPAWPDRRAAILRLNAAAVAEAARHRPDVVLVMHIVAAPAAATIRRTLGIPTVTYLHASEVPARPRLAGLAVRTSDRIVAVSRYTAGLAVEAGADPARIRVIAPGVDWAEPPVAPRLTTPTVVTIARIEERYKGHDVLTRAMPLVRSRAPGARCVVVGDGPLRPDIARLADAHGLDGAVRLCGILSDEERDRWLDTAHVFAMPSRVPHDGAAGEGFGIAYLEAGVHGLPVVAGHAGGALDAVVDGTTGVLVDPTDHVAVADAIAGLLTDPSRARRMGAAGNARAREFAWGRVAARVEDLLRETAAAR